MAALVLRFVGLSGPGLWHDEALSHFYARQDVGWLLYYCARQINHPPLFFLLLKGWLTLIPTYSQFAVEVLPALFGVATVGLVLHWGRLRLPRCGWIPGLLLAANVFHVYYSGELRMYALQVFFLTCAGYFADRLLENPRTARWSGFGLACLLALYTHSFSAVWVAVFVLLLGFFLARRRPIPFSATVLGVAVLYSPWGYYVVNQALRISSGYWIAPFRGSYLLELGRILGGFGGQSPVGWYAFWGVLALWAGLYYPACCALRTDKRSVAWLLGTSVVVPVLLVTILSLTGQSLFLYRIFLPVLPFLLVLAGRGLIEYGNPVLALILVLYGAFLVAETLELKQHPPHEYAREVAEWTEKRNLKNVRLVHTSAFTYFPSIFYHGNRYDEYLQSGGEHIRRPIEPVTLRQLLRKGERVFLLVSGEPPETFVEEVETSLQWLDRKTVSDRTFRLYRIVPEKISG